MMEFHHALLLTELFFGPFFGDPSSFYVDLFRTDSRVHQHQCPIVDHLGKAASHQSRGGFPFFIAEAKLPHVQGNHHVFVMGQHGKFSIQRRYGEHLTAPIVEHSVGGYDLQTKRVGHGNPPCTLSVGVAGELFRLFLHVLDGTYIKEGGFGVLVHFTSYNGAKPGDGVL